MQTGAALSLRGWRLRERTASLCSSAMWMPWFAAVLDLDTAGECLYGNDVDIDDIIWMGPQPTVASKGVLIGCGAFFRDISPPC